MKQPRRFRKRPVQVEAIPFNGKNHDDIVRFAGLKARVQGRENALVILTEEGPLTASPLDWIVQGVKGEFYPVKPDVFEATYERVES